MAIMTGAEMLEILQDADFNTTATFHSLAHRYVATDNSVVEGTETDYTEYISPPYYQDRYSSGALVPQGNMIVVLANAGLSFTPTKGWHVTIDSDRWVIDEIFSIHGGENSICAYEIGLKK